MESDAPVIGQNRRQRTFTDIYVFPDGDLTPISTTLNCAEEAGFEVRDLENLREHYYLTLRHWLRRMESHMDPDELVGELKAKIWRLTLPDPLIISTQESWTSINRY